MQAGQVISGAAHASFIALIMVGWLDTPSRPLDMNAVAEVTLITSAQLEAFASAPPAVSEVTEVLTEATIDAVTPDAPAVDVAPVATSAEAVAAPQVPDGAADMSALLAQAAVQSAVSVESPDVVMPDVGGDVAPQMPTVTSEGNERNTTATLLRPPPPREAPRIDTTPAEPSPVPAELAPVSRPETSPQVAPDITPDDPQLASAPAEATTEIRPEAQPDAPIAADAPVMSAMPTRRPRNMAAAAQQVEAAAEVTRRAVAQAQEAAAAAQQQADQQADIDAQAAAIEAALMQAASQLASSNQTAALNGPESSAIAGMVSANWNKSLLLEQPNYEQYVVRVSVPLDASGNLAGSIEPYDPVAPAGYYQVAYQAAERAIRMALPIALPTDRFPDGATLILLFDPVTGVGF